MTTLIIDGYNFLHRARSGFQLGEYSTIFNFFRNLRSLIETFQKSDNINKVIFVLEGRPQFRYDILESYKANRLVEEGTEKHKSNVDFHRQKNLIINLLETYFPISVMRHPNFECDDLIYNIVKNASKSSQFIVVSNDSDFTQLIQECENCRLYNPMKKTFVDVPTYSYITWKALRGDGCDNIPGIPGIGDKRAQQLVENLDKLEDYLKKNNESAIIFNRNYKLIKFANFNDDDLAKVTCSNPQKNWEQVAFKFNEWQFQSIIKTFYNKFVPTFDKLWCVSES